MKANPTAHRQVRGFTDSTGSEAHNQRLSEARANAVRDYFIKQGIAPARVRAKGFGQSNPVASNDTVEGRAMNRRWNCTRINNDQIAVIRISPLEVAPKASSRGQSSVGSR